MCRQQVIADETENDIDVFQELVDYLEMQKEKEDQSQGRIILFNSYFHECPRCEERTLMTGKYPYCSSCNWDSLSNSKAPNKWAA